MALTIDVFLYQHPFSLSTVHYVGHSPPGDTQLLYKLDLFSKCKT